MKTTFLCFSAWCKCHIGCLAICKAKVLIFKFFFSSVICWWWGIAIISGLMWHKVGFHAGVCSYELMLYQVRHFILKRYILNSLYGGLDLSHFLIEGYVLWCSVMHRSLNNCFWKYTNLSSRPFCLCLHPPSWQYGTIAQNIDTMSWCAVNFPSLIVFTITVSWYWRWDSPRQFHSHKRYLW